MTLARLVLMLGLLTVAGWTSVAYSEDPQPATPAEQPAAEPELTQEELEKRFEETLSGSQMIGSFTLTGGPADQPLKEDKYTINKVKKLKNGYWLFDATIQYGGNNTRIPITLPVKWAGDTPVITVTNVLVPGMGTFSARVLVYKDQYAGTWSGGDHGGHMIGRIVKLGAEESTAKSEEKKVSQKEGSDEPTKK
ncbi:MAG: hypothetical protein JNG90_03650 [Planctomycetaceae bacterium]|nr:hypothetical protein [Planctomycetaceae bacterium]